MTDYTKLATALRYCTDHEPMNGDCAGCPYDGKACHTMLSDAAAAIEDMAKHITEMHERVTVLQIARGELEAEVDALKHDIKRYVRINAELHAELERWVSAAEKAGEPKRGEWKPFDLTYGRSIYSCSVCEQATEVPMCMEKPMYAYCPNCGAKMEAHE